MRARGAVWVIAAGVGAGVAVLLLSPAPWLVPFVQAAMIWPLLWRGLREGRLAAAAGQMLAWAAISSVAVILATLLFPERAAEAILRGTAYREEMFLWIRTGIGPEGNPALFVPEHIRHYAMTLALSAVTAGFAGLVLGAVLLNYMNFYVGSLLLSGGDPWFGVLFGWPVWSVLRVIGFVFGAIAVASILPALLRRAPRPGTEARRLMLWSLAFFLADIAVKWTLAPTWRKLLERALGQD